MTPEPTKMAPLEHIKRHLDCHEKELSALYAIGKLLSGYSGDGQLLPSVLRILEETLDMRRSTVLLHSPDTGELVVEAAHPSTTSVQPDARYRKGEGIVGRVLMSGEPEIVRSIKLDERFQGRIHGREPRQDDALSFICVPIALGSEVVGTVSVDLPYSGDEHLHESQRFLSIVAGLIAYDVRARMTARMARNAMEAENLRLRTALGERFRPKNIIGNSDAMRTVYERIHQVAPSEATVLIRGESGTGKELVASAIHYNSPRAKRPMVRVNCAALSESLIESELFGHERGAFTGAIKARVGRIEEAEGGTLFLDEIGDFSPAIQVKLLRVLQEREYERVGSNTRRHADVRIIAATNRDLEKAVQESRFRDDLYYRINVFPIRLPSLRERKSDILLLADHFVARYADQSGKGIRRISTAAINAMLAYHWPGNVRELENCIEHSVLLSTDGVIHAHNLPPTLQLPDASENRTGGTLKAQIQLLERDMIIDALKRYRGSVADAANELGITPRMVRYKIKGLGIDAPRTFKP